MTEFKCDPLIQDSEKHTPLHCAAYYGHTAVLEKLIREFKCPAEVRGGSASTILHHAAGGGHKSLVRKLISEYGFDPTEPDAQGCNALHNAISHAFSGPNDKNPFDPLACIGDFHNSDDLSHVDTIQMLLSEYKCPKDSKNLMDETPLMCALKNGNSDVIRLFTTNFSADSKKKFNSGQNLMNRNYRDSQGRTQLHIAAAMGNIEEIEKCISVYGIDLLVRDYQGATALHTAMLQGQELAARKLIALGCPPDVGSDADHTPLHCAAQSGHLRLIKMLISEFNCDPMCVENTGSLPLHQAASGNQAEAVRVLITEYGCDVNSVNAGLLTPLHIACHQGFTKTARVLCELGADTNARDFAGNTPLSLATQTGHVSVIEMLRSATDFSKGDKIAKNTSKKAQNQEATDFIKLVKGERYN